MSFKIKVDDTIEQYSIYGEAPNGSLIVGLTDYGADKIYQYLMDGKDVKCIIAIGSTKYNYTIISSGFSDAWNSPDEYAAPTGPL